MSSRVLIWITCRNYEGFLTQAAQSVREQQRSCFVAVRHDCCGGSHAQGVAFMRNLSLVYGPPKYPPKCYVGKFDYVIFLDADDKLPPEYVSELLKTANGDPCVVACPAKLFGDEDRTVEVRQPVTLETLLEGNTVHCSALIPFKAFAEVGGFNPMLSSHEDWDLWCRLAARGVEFRVNNATRLFYRRHAGSRSKQNPDGFWEMKKRLNDEYRKEKV